MENILLISTLCLCTITIIYSLLILKKFKKINKLASLVYNELRNNDVDEKKSEKETYSVFNKDEMNAIQILDNNDTTSHTQQMTRAEAHLMKILQSRTRN